MDAAVQKRIDQAWKVSQGWIMEFSGAPTVTLFVNVPSEAVFPGLSAIAGEAENLRITVIADKPAEPQFIPLDAVPAQLQLLLEGKNAEVSANWATHRPEFDLDVHMVIHPLGNGLVSLELDWWSDQVFSDEEDNPAQFRALMDYFIGLQQQFSAPNLFLSAESGLDPNAQDNAWVEV